MAAQPSDVILLVLLATIGSRSADTSAIWSASAAACLPRKTHPPRIFKRVCQWMESHDPRRRPASDPSAAHAAQPLRPCSGRSQDVAQKIHDRLHHQPRHSVTSSQRGWLH